MNLKKEQKYIRNFFEQLTDREFIEMLDRCGNNTILPTEEIYHKFLLEGFYSENNKYSIKSGYQISTKHKRYKKYDKNFSEYGQGAVA